MTTVEEARQVLIAHGRLPVIDDTGRQGFLECARKGALALVQAYLALGMPLETTTGRYDETTALIAAVEGNHAALIRFLIETGADLEALDGDGDTALQTVVNWQHPEALELLIAAGGNLHGVSKQGWTPLTKAAHLGDLRLVQLLLEAGANVNQVPPGGMTALQYAAQDGEREITRLLLAAGADLNARQGADDRPLLSQVILQGQSAQALDLIADGADLQATNRFGWTPWMVACLQDQAQLAEAIRSSGGDTSGAEHVAFIQVARRRSSTPVKQAILRSLRLCLPLAQMPTPRTSPAGPG
jgi:cytohesin